jgi:membrane-bound lytic murein transglycosylase B
VVELDHKQPEKTKTFTEYLKNAVTAKRIADAKDRWQDNKAILRKVEAKYHVEPQILLALWCVESHFGERQGNYSTIQALATLSYDGRRSQFFRTELLNALKIMQDENIAAKDLTGSWAGAMGQVQFMPSSFLNFAVDFDGNGKKDIWESNADALASMANYLHSKGWEHKQGWGVEVTLPPTKDDIVINWQAEKADKNLPNSELIAHLVVPDGDAGDSPAYLAYPNYDIIMDWNHSIYFATSVGLLADGIAK